MKYINFGMPTTKWHGITAEQLLRRCAQASEEQAQAMSLLAGLMHAGERITTREFAAAAVALHEVERRLIESWTGEVPVNRHGQAAGGQHPALV